jgi:DNA-binding XRE family transcriptional regulator
VKSKELRERLGLSRSEWARALNVNDRTIQRWEDDGVDPGGLANEVMRGIHNAIEEGVDPKRVGRLISLGVGSVLFTELLRELKR